MTEVNERAEALSGADANVSLLAKDQYFRELAWMEPLADEERNKLLQRVIRGNTERTQSCPNQCVLSLAHHARERLVEAYQPYIVGMARRRVSMFKSMELLDVVQEGNIGLLEALNEYDEELARVVEFKAVMVTRVKFAMIEAARSSDALVRGTWRIHDLVARKRVVESDLYEQLGRQPLLSEIAQTMQVSEEKLYNALHLAKREEVASLHELTEHTEIAEDKFSFTSLYASAVVAEDTRQQELAATFERVLEVEMSEKQRDVLQLRYGFGESSTTMRSLKVVSEMLGYESTQQVTRQEARAIQHLRGVLEPVVLPDGRVSCRFEDVYSEDYCTSREAAELLQVSLGTIDNYAEQGVLVYEMRPRPRIGGKMRYFKKADVIALQQERVAVPVKLSSRRRESASLKQARRSASLPAIVA